jgi:tRNA pseudouridine(38-40) synthase
VEDALHLALFKAGGIRPCNSESFQKVSWSRSARTDRGVHAASQVIAAKLHIPGPESGDGGDVSKTDEATFVAKVNSFLPDQIRVYRVLRVANNFNARSATDSRTYGYFLPTSVLQREGASLDELLVELRGMLKIFVGTHSFHNYTEKMAPRDPRCMRLIHGQSVSLCVWLCLSMSVCLSFCVCLCLCQYVYMSVSVCVCQYLSVYVSVCLFLCVYVSMLWCLSVSVCVSMCLSVYVYVVDFCLRVCNCVYFCAIVGGVAHQPP